MAIAVFISYRRTDSLETASHLWRSLQQHYKRDDIFFDFARESPGAILVDKLVDGVRNTDVLIAVIGPRWHERLDEPSDAVRIELETAIAAGIRIFPVLVGGAPMPRAVPGILGAAMRFEALVLRAIEFDEDVKTLVGAIEMERSRRRAEEKLTRELAEARQEGRFVAAVRAAEALVPIAWDRGKAQADLDGARQRYQHVVEKTRGLIDAAEAALIDHRFDLARESCAEAIRILSDEPAYLSLRTRIEDRQRDYAIRTQVAAVVESAQGHLNGFVTEAAQALTSAARTDDEFVKALQAKQYLLRRALLRDPRNRRLRTVYLAARTQNLQAQDRIRASFMKATVIVAAGFVPFAVVGSVVWWRWLPNDAMGAFSWATVPMFTLAWIACLRALNNTPWGPDADSSAGFAGCLTFLVIIAIPGTFVIADENEWPALPVLAYFAAIAWFAWASFAFAGTDTDGPQPLSWHVRHPDF